METISGWAQNISYQVSDGAVEQREFISALHDGHSGGDAHHHDDFCIHSNIKGGGWISFIPYICFFSFYSR